MSVPFTQLDKLYIDGAWVDVDGPREAVLNPEPKRSSVMHRMVICRAPTQPSPPHATPLITALGPG